MKIAIESTPTTTTIDGVPVRLWTGITESGVPCLVFVHRVTTGLHRDSTEFERDLESVERPAELMRLDTLLGRTAL